MQRIGWSALVVSVGLALATGACFCNGPTGAPTKEWCDPNFDDAGMVMTREVVIGELREGELVPYQEGGIGHVVRGLQGSDMLLPVVRISRMPDEPERICSMVEITSEATNEHSLPEPVQLEANGDWFESGTIAHPFFDGEDQLTLRATVEAMGFGGEIGPIRVRLED